MLVLSSVIGCVTRLLKLIVPKVVSCCRHRVQVPVVLSLCGDCVVVTVVLVLRFRLPKLETVVWTVPRVLFPALVGRRLCSSVSALLVLNMAKLCWSLVRVRLIRRNPSFSVRKAETCGWCLLSVWVSRCLVCLDTLCVVPPAKATVATWLGVTFRWIRRVTPLATMCAPLEFVLVSMSSGLLMRVMVVCRVGPSDMVRGVMWGVRVQLVCDCSWYW